MGTDLRQILNRKLLAPLCYCIAFAALAWYFLYVRNADTMYFLQDRGLWNSTDLFWEDCMRLPGGLLAWTGAYLTQCFYHPALGSAMLIALWLLTWAMTQVMSNTATCALFCPIGWTIAKTLGADPRAVVIAISMSGKRRWNTKHRAFRASSSHGSCS